MVVSQSSDARPLSQAASSRFERASTLVGAFQSSPELIEAMFLPRHAAHTLICLKPAFSRRSLAALTAWKAGRVNYSAYCSFTKPTYG
jgi:hypothetical protein